MAPFYNRKQEGSGDALTSNPLSQFAATTSAQLAGVISDETGSGSLVFATSPTLVTPVLGTPTSGTLTNCTGLPAAGVTGTALVASAIGTTVQAYDADLTTWAGITPGANVGTFLATPSSANLAAAVTDETGSGALVFGTSPSLTTPTLGVASATSINKVALTAPATSATLTIADGKTLTASNSITLAGTDSTTMTFPSTSATIARTDAANTFTGIQTITNQTFPTNGQLKLTVPTTDGHATGFTCGDYNSGYSSSAVGDLVYLDSSNTWQKCDANTLALYNGLLGIALEVKASGNALLVALPGSFVYATGFPTFTVGSPIYMSETAGAVTQTAPTTADSATRVLGWAVHADKMYFFPSPNYIVHV